MTSLVSFSANCPGPESMAYNYKRNVMILSSSVELIRLVYLDGSAGQCVLPLDDELVAVAADQLHIPRKY